MKKVLLVLIILGLFGCEEAVVADNDTKDDCIEKIDANKFCTEQYDPVCGCNLKTYGNACSASIYGIRVLYKGECKK